MTDDGESRIEGKHRGVSRPLVTAVGAFLLYGGWAAYANWGHGQAAVATAGVAQGAMSFGTTLTISMLTERLVVIPGSIVLGIGFAAVLSPTLVGIAMAAVHSVLRTPEIMVTVAPTMIVGFVYTTIYATIVGLEENRRRNSAHAESMGRPSAG